MLWHCHGLHSRNEQQGSKVQFEEFFRRSSNLNTRYINLQSVLVGIDFSAVCSLATAFSDVVNPPPFANRYKEQWLERTLSPSKKNSLKKATFSENFSLPEHTNGNAHSDQERELQKLCTSRDGAMVAYFLITFLQHRRTVHARVVFHLCGVIVTYLRFFISQRCE